MGSKNSKRVNQSHKLTYEEIYADDDFFWCKDKSKFKNTDVIGIQYTYDHVSEYTEKSGFSSYERNTHTSQGGSVYYTDKNKIKRVIGEISVIPDDVENKQNVLDILNMLNKIEINLDDLEELIVVEKAEKDKN